jgi:hypothetical protein
LRADLHSTPAFPLERVFADTANIAGACSLCAPALQLLQCLPSDVVYTGLNRDHREAIAELSELDPVSEDMLTGDLAKLEQFQWFVRAHLESSSGELATAGQQSEQRAAKAARS